MQGFAWVGVTSCSGSCILLGFLRKSYVRHSAQYAILVRNQRLSQVLQPPSYFRTWWWTWQAVTNTEPLLHPVLFCFFDWGLLELTCFCSVSRISSNSNELHVEVELAIVSAINCTILCVHVWCNNPSFPPTKGICVTHDLHNRFCLILATNSLSARSNPYRSGIIVRVCMYAAQKLQTLV